MLKYYFFQIFFIPSLMWLIAILDIFLPFINHYGIYPRTFIGIPGILFNTFLHADLAEYSSHLINNTILILFLLTLLFSFNKDFFQKIIWSIIFLTGSLVWLFGRPYNHIGASGLIFGLLSFFLFIGIFQKDIKSILSSLVFLSLYGILFGNVSIWDPNILKYLKSLLNQILILSVFILGILGFIEKRIKYLLYSLGLFIIYMFFTPSSNLDILGSFYKQIFRGLFPDNPNISWEAHNFGFISGIFVAYIYSRSKKTNKKHA